MLYLPTGLQLLFNVTPTMAGIKKKKIKKRNNNNKIE
jgi:hypothetical protein